MLADSTLITVADVCLVYTSVVNKTHLVLKKKTFFIIFECFLSFANAFAGRNTQQLLLQYEILRNW